MSIARALSRQVRLLIMDEPSAILDDNEIDTLFDVVRRLTAEGVGVIYISHRLDEIGRIGDRVTVMTEGTTVASGLPAATKPDDLVTLMVGRELEQLFPDRPVGGGDVVLEVKGLSRRPDVLDVSLELRAGEVLGIAGLVGAGRSELLRAIYGVDRRDEGEVIVAGRPLPPHRPDRAIVAGLGLAPEDRKSQALLLEWNLTKNVSLADLRRFQRVLLRVRAEQAAVEEQLQHLRTTPSDGDRMARAVGRQPAEGGAGPLAPAPVPRAVARRAHPRRRCRDEGRTVPDHRRPGRAGPRRRGGLVGDRGAVRLCTRILVMREGRLVAELDGAATELDVLRHAMPGTQEIFVDEEVGAGRMTTREGCDVDDNGSGARRRTPRLGRLALPAGLKLQESRWSG